MMLLAIAVLLATACSTSAVSSAPSTGSVTVQRVRELLADPNLAPPARIAPEDAYCKTRCMLTHEPQVVERCTGWIVVLIQRGDDIVHECISRDQLSAALISRIQSDLSHDESHLRIPIAPLDGRRTEGETRDFIIQGGDESKPLTLFEHLLEREISTDGFVSYNNLNKDVELGLTGNHKLERRAAILPFQSRFETETDGGFGSKIQRTGLKIDKISHELSADSDTVISKKVLKPKLGSIIGRRKE